MGLNLTEVEAVVKKLLDKAGTDDRLTPRLLRQKVEQKMKIEPDSLLPLKTEILEMISDWWDKNFPEKVVSGGQQPTSSSINNLSKFARAVGKGPAFFKTLNQSSDEEKATDILKRLLEEGYEVSLTPTAEEIENAKKEHDLKKEMSDIDSSLILKRDRRSAEVDSNADDNTTVEESSDKVNRADGDTVREQNGQSPISKKVKHSDEEVDGEEEAEF